MSGNDLWFEEPGDELRDEEYPDDDLDDEFGDDSDDEYSQTVACPECGTEVYEDAVQCPVCGNYITHHRNVFSGRPTWWIILALLGILAVVLVFSGLLSW